MAQKRKLSNEKSLSFSDKISGAAIILALVSLAVSVWTTIEQKKQWRASTLGKVDLVDCGFVFWKTFSEKELPDVKWGYKVDVMPLMESRRLTGQYGLPSRLLVFNSSTNKLIPNIFGTTVAEIDEKIKQAGLPSQSLVLRKHFQIEFEFKKIGESTVTGLTIGVSPQMPDTGQWDTGVASQPVDLAPGKSIFKIVDLYAPVNENLPEKLKFMVNLNYTNAEGTRITRHEPLYYNTNTASFNLGN